MKRKRQVRSQIRNCQPSERPDPFKPPKSWYFERGNVGNIKYHYDHSRKCTSRGSPFTDMSDWQHQKLAANWQYNQRVDSHVQDLSRHCPHKTITDGFIKLTDSRFDTNYGSTFLAGEITETSPERARLRMRNTMQGKSKSFSFSGRVSLDNSVQHVTNPVSSRMNEYSNMSKQNQSKFSESLPLGVKRPLVANLANVPTVKIGQYSKRDPDKLFYPQGQHPISSDTEGHGGVYYNTQNYGKIVWNNNSSHVLPFERNVVPMKDQIKRIESVTRKTKVLD